MLTRSRRFKKFVGANASIIIAISSLFIAGLSLYFTIHAQNDDRAYKELLIKPALAIRTHSVDFSVELASEGLGPAEIKAVAYQFGGECLSLLDTDGALNKTQIREGERGNSQEATE